MADMKEDRLETNPALSRELLEGLKRPELIALCKKHEIKCSGKVQPPGTGRLKSHFK